MKAKCRKCNDTVEVTKLREYKTCKCGAIGLDYGDGYYYRVCGDPEDFDGEIEGAPNNLGITKVEDPHKPEEIDVILNDYSTEELDNLMHDNHRDLSHEAVVVDNFWVEIAEHFRAIAELCEERSKNGK